MNENNLKKSNSAIKKCFYSREINFLEISISPCR